MQPHCTVVYRNSLRNTHASTPDQQQLPATATVVAQIIRRGSLISNIIAGNMSQPPNQTNDLNHFITKAKVNRSSISQRYYPIETTEWSRSREAASNTATTPNVVSYST